MLKKSFKTIEAIKIIFILTFKSATNLKDTGILVLVLPPVTLQHACI